QGEALKKCIEHGIRKEGLESFCAGVRYLKMPVLDIAKNPEKAQEEILNEGQELIKTQGADVIVLGCTALSHEVDLKPIMKKLSVPVIDPWVVAIKTAFMLVESGLTHSRMAYPFPPKKKINEAPCLKGAFDDILMQE
ncbi:MAG: aspartate/glutamate racemase family protein, partial [Candidatus Thorarchaeota archaeon SMTZ1-45]